MKDRKNWGYLTELDLGMDKEAIKRSFASHVEYSQGKDQFSVTDEDFFQAIAHSTRDRLVDRWNRTQRAYHERGARRVYYLSLEFLTGRLLRDALDNLGMHGTAADALSDFGLELEHIAEHEWDLGLGNGGLGRLAACFLDSMATLGIPAMGYGIRYEYGIFRQLIEHGMQIEAPDHWLRYGCPWEIPRFETMYPVKLHGRVHQHTDAHGRAVFDWVDTENVMALAYDIPVPGYRNDVVNTLRLWSAKATREFELGYFNQGNYVQAVQEKNATENISRVLYPSDKVREGRELRLKQEYFFVSATLQDAIRRHGKHSRTLLDLHERAVFQLNDTHPAIAIAEMMRLLVDVHGIGWDDAWHVTTHAFAYTNHTVLPEALEVWPVSLVQDVLPRHMQIIFEINRRFLDDVRKQWHGDETRVQRMSIISEQGERHVRMAHLAIVGSFSVNGVSALHTGILAERIFVDFAHMWPHKFNNKTNGVTPRRWLSSSNPPLASVITKRVGEGWVRRLRDLEKLEQYADDPELHAEWIRAKQTNKERLARHVKHVDGVEMDPTSIFDVQVKRMHEYKRQLLNILHVVSLYQEYTRKRPTDVPARTFIFGGKAAPGYDMAKRIIHLIHTIGAAIEADKSVNDLLHVVFLPNYGVSLAERVIPAADVSEQISTAGMEASGTGNMKMSLNGALTIGTLDGANVEIREAVGADNFFLFGLTEPEVNALRPHYSPRRIYEEDPVVRDVIDALRSGWLYPEDRQFYTPIVDSLLYRDPYFVLADFQSYRAAHRTVADAWRDRAGWTRKSILNVARMGGFSSDETIDRYAREIWKVL